MAMWIPIHDPLMKKRIPSEEELNECVFASGNKEYYFHNGVCEHPVMVECREKPRPIGYLGISWKEYLLS